MATVMMTVALAAGLLAPQQGPGGLMWTSDVQFAASNAWWDALPRTTYDNVLILDRGDNSRTPSCGIIAYRIAVKGRLPSGEVVFFHQGWCAANDPAPPIGGQCRLEVMTLKGGADGAISGETDRPDDPIGAMNYLARSIESFRCTISSDSPSTPGRLTHPEYATLETTLPPRAPTIGRIPVVRPPDIGAPGDLPSAELRVTAVSRGADAPGAASSWIVVTAVDPGTRPFTFAIRYEEGQPLPPLHGRCRFIAGSPQVGRADLPSDAGAAMVASRFDCAITDGQVPTETSLAQPQG